MEDDLRDVFIRRVVNGRTFCDVGGLWGTKNEKISVADSAGAASLSMVDIAPDDHPLWNRFRSHLSVRGVKDIRCVSANVDLPHVERVTGRFDVVHCSGVIYHCPNPVHTLAQLRRMTKGFLILTSMVVPSVVDTVDGRFELGPGESVFVPHLQQDRVKILRSHFQALGVKSVTGITVPVDEWRVDDYGPWWWIFTPSTLRQLLLATGFTVLDEGPRWPGRSHTFLAAARGAGLLAVSGGGAARAKVATGSSSPRLDG
jgi:hypothetical protein